MQKLVKDGELCHNEWDVIDADDVDLSHIGEGKIVLPLELFKIELESGNLDFERHGVSLKSDDDVSEIADVANKLKIIVLHFRAFTDGRSFSQARILREQLDFEGELRAEGAYIQDQLFYLSRCGVNAFMLPEGANVDAALKSLRDFSVNYQAACDEPQPLFRRRV